MVCDFIDWTSFLSSGYCASAQKRRIDQSMFNLEMCKDAGL